MGEVRRDRGTGMRPRLRPDGRWEARYTGLDGKAHSVYSRKPGKAGEREVIRLRDEALRLVVAGVTPSLMPLAEYLERHLARQSRSLAPASLERYRRLVRLHVQPLPAGRIQLARLRPDDLDDLYADRLAAGMAPKGVELLHTVIHGALATAAARGHVIRNVADMVRRPRVRHEPRTTLSAAELARLLDEAAGSRIEALLTLIGQVGLRHGEALGIRVSDLSDDRSRLVLRSPEKGAPPRTILLPARSQRAVRAQLVRIAADKLASRGAYDDAGLLFADPYGEPLDQRRVRDELHRIAKRAAVATTVHGLRHTCATLLMEQGIPPKVVQELLGHATVRQTLDTYSHVTPTMQAAAVAAMDRVVGS